MAENNTIRVYRLVDPSIIYLNADKIAYYFFGMPQLVTKDKTFSVDTNTGFFTYTDNGQLFTNYQKQKLPKNKNEAQKAADAFMLRANALIQKEPFFVKQSFPLLFSNLKFTGAKSVGHPEKRWIDHWEVIYQGYVKPNTNEKEVVVIESKVIFKIGNMGQIISTLYNWYVISESEISEKIGANDLAIVYSKHPIKLLLSPFYIKTEE